MMRFAIVLLGLLAFQSSRAAVTITYPIVELPSWYAFGIEFDIPSLNIGEPSTKTDFLDEVTNVRFTMSGDDLGSLRPPNPVESAIFSWFEYLYIGWTGVRHETAISGKILFGFFVPDVNSHFGRVIWFGNGPEHGTVQLYEEFLTIGPPELIDVISGEFESKYITYRDPSGAIPEPWGFGLALPVLLLLRRRRPKVSTEY